MIYNTADIKGYGLTSTRHSTKCSQFKKKGGRGLPHINMAHRKNPGEMFCTDTGTNDGCPKQN